MHACHIMTPSPATVGPETSIAEAAALMLRMRISGVPVVDAAGSLVGIVSEGDFLRRTELGTRRRRSTWLSFLTSSGKLAAEFIREAGQSVADVMTPNPITISESTPVQEIVSLMEQREIKRLPVVRDKVLVGIVTRTNLLQAVASLARTAPQMAVDDLDLRQQILSTLEAEPWCPMGLNIIVRNGMVELGGVIADSRQREAAKVAAEGIPGVVTVHDHLIWIDTATGTYFHAEEERLSSNSRS